MSQIIPLPLTDTQPLDIQDAADQGLINYTPWGGRVKPPETIHEFIIHEQGDPLWEIIIQKQGLSSLEMEKEIQRQTLKAKEQGIENVRLQSEDWRTAKLQEIRGKPIGYAHEYNGLDKVLREYREGTFVFDYQTAATIMVSPCHYRTWGGPGFIDIGGAVHKEPMDRDKFEEHWRKTGRFSKIVWVDDWEEFQKIR